MGHGTMAMAEPRPTCFHRHGRRRSSLTSGKEQARAGPLDPPPRGLGIDRCRRPRRSRCRGRGRSPRAADASRRVACRLGASTSSGSQVRPARPRSRVRIVALDPELCTGTAGCLAQRAATDGPGSQPRPPGEVPAVRNAGTRMAGAGGPDSWRTTVSATARPAVLFRESEPQSLSQAACDAFRPWWTRAPPRGQQVPQGGSMTMMGYFKRCRHRSLSSGAITVVYFKPCRNRSSPAARRIAHARFAP